MGCFSQSDELSLITNFLKKYGSKKEKITNIPELANMINRSFQANQDYINKRFDEVKGDIKGVEKKLEGDIKRVEKK